MSEKTFPCTGCGACCKRVDRLIIAHGIDKMTPEDPLSFPYKHDETGKCEMLLPDNNCAVYEDRPLICSIDRTGAYLGIPKENLYYNNIKSCNRMQEEDKLDKKFRIGFPGWIRRALPHLFIRKPRGKGIGSNFTPPKKKRK